MYHILYQKTKMLISQIWISRLENEAGWQRNKVLSPSSLNIMSNSAAITNTFKQHKIIWIDVANYLHTDAILYGHGLRDTHKVI